jgi:hypothetical protein
MTFTSEPRLPCGPIFESHLEMRVTTLADSRWRGKWDFPIPIGTNGAPVFEVQRPLIGELGHEGAGYWTPTLIYDLNVPLRHNGYVERVIEEQSEKSNTGQNASSFVHVNFLAEDDSKA